MSEAFFVVCQAIAQWMSSPLSRGFHCQHCTRLFCQEKRGFRGRERRWWGKEEEDEEEEGEEGRCKGKFFMTEEEWRWALLPACLEAVTRTVSTLSRYLPLDYSPVLRLFKGPFFGPFFFFHCGLQDFQAPVNTHTHKDTLLFRLSFPHSCALFFLLCPISLPMCLPLPLYPSIYPSHMGFTSLLSTMACFVLFFSFKNGAMDG